MTHPEGKLDVDEMLDEMTPAQFEGWFQFYRIKPWGDDWHRTSRTTAAIINKVTESTPRTEALQPSDYLEHDVFVPAWCKPGESPEDKETEARCEAADRIEGFGF